jgi:hypothetical protein
MGQLETQILTLLDTIQGNGSFAVSGDKKFIPPGLHIEGIGEIGFPLTESQAKAIIGLAKRAPYGKGSQTITDTSVRSAWEIDAKAVSFRNDEWEYFLNKILKKVKEGLGIENRRVTASLYKLLLYETGDFFLPHKDSEKEPGMFGTMVVALPAAHTGGELVVRFDGREETIGFSEAVSAYRIPYAAFFADCDHEIKPIRSGYRISLVYNLLQPKGEGKIGGNTWSEQVERMVPLLKSLAATFEDKPKAILLSHQYTPANFSLESLKLHDRPRAEALLEAAGKAGYFASLGLVTHYLMGDLEGGDYDDYYGRGRYSRREPVEKSMGDVHEMYTKIEYWSGDGAPTLGGIHMDEDDLLTNLEIGEGDPIEQAEEGYTGNAGMTMEYWYHYGAVVIWPKSKHANLLKNAPAHVRMKWLDFYGEHWEDAALQSQQYARHLIQGFTPEDLKDKYNVEDCSPVAAVLIKMADTNFLKKQGLPLLEASFNKIPPDGWLVLMEQYEPALFEPIFQTADGVKSLYHSLEILAEVAAESAPNLRRFLLKQLGELPARMKPAKLSKLEKDGYEYMSYKELSRKQRIEHIVRRTLQLSRFLESDEAWLKDAAEALTQPLPRDYANQILAAILLDQQHHAGKLANALRQILIKDLTKRTAVQPTPPPDWSRPVPNTKHDRPIWDLLRPFLESPVQQVFEYRKNESYRQEMERAIRRVRIDLATETIRKGSPHTLKLTKTQAAYELALKEWKEDVEILKELGKG